MLSNTEGAREREGVGAHEIVLGKGTKGACENIAEVYGDIYGDEAVDVYEYVGRYVDIGLLRTSSNHVVSGRKADDTDNTLGSNVEEDGLIGVEILEVELLDEQALWRLAISYGRSEENAVCCGGKRDSGEEE